MTDAVLSAPAEPADHAVHEHVDLQANKIGMWLFLTTEVLLFGGLFISYAVYYFTYKFYFKEGSHELSIPMGGLNTVILLTSSLTMVLAIATLQKGKRGMSLALLGVTLAFALGFLVVKSFEWGAKFSHGYYPQGPAIVDQPAGVKIFVGLYFLSTGLHAFHVLVGMALIGYVMWRVARGLTTQDRISWIDNVGLYWHLVDLIWIYLFPLYYLIS